MLFINRDSKSQFVFLIPVSSMAEMTWDMILQNLTMIFINLNKIYINMNFDEFTYLGLKVACGLLVLLARHS